jgi:large exoprotein involved in heme utilization and adhesion
LGSRDAVAGTINIDATRIFAEGNSLIRSDNLGTGQAGTININTDTLNLTDGAAITASTFGVGDAGTINVTAQNIVLDQEFTGIYSNVGLTSVATDELVSNARGNGGKITINTGDLSLNDGARIASNSVAQGNAGVVDINATGAVSYTGQGDTLIPAFNNTPVISGSFSQVQQEGNGNAGEVNITADSLKLEGKGAVLVDNSGVGGNAGDITFNIQNNISLDQTGLILAQVQSGATGNGGDINIAAGSLEAKGNSQIAADTKGIGDAGNIKLDIEETLSLDETSFILTEVGQDAVGNAGDITITANSLIVKNDADIASQTKGQGDAGKIFISTNDDILLENRGEIRSLVESATGNGGDVSLKTGELNLTNKSQIIADTIGQSLNEGEITAAGDISIDVTDDTNLDNNSKIQSQTRDGAVGNAGNITINTGGSLFSTNGNLILADSQAEGNGGNITINAGEQIVLKGIPEGGFPSQIVAGLGENADGKGGDIEIKASELILDDVAFISSNTVSNSSGSAGAITINADSLHLMNNSFINALTANDNVAGAIAINAQTLNLSSGGKILAVTDGKGDAGNINLNISGDIQINNSIESSTQFDFAAASPSRSSQLLNDLQDLPGGVYADATENARGSGGNINVTGNSLLLDNARIAASTGFGQGGVVNLTIADNLTLDNESIISAEAKERANGGNLNIDSKFIIAYFNGNSDILANAERGTGGKININAESLFGIQERTPSNTTNDINASSEFDLDGSVNINTSDINPLQGATELPSNIVQTTQTDAQTCSADREGKVNNGLAIAGRGGVTPAPDAPLNSENISNENPAQANIPQPLETSQGKIQPARGIKVNKSGKIVLTAYRTDNAGERIPDKKINCGQI